MRALIFILFSCQVLNAQISALPQNKRDTSGGPSVELVLRSRYTGKEVRLRWAPTKPGAWTLLNKTGYVLERFERDENGLAINLTKLSASAIKPEPLEQWKRFAGDTPDKNALIAAQAIYGKKFTAAGSRRMGQKIDDLTNRYSFALLAADLSYETALASGLAFIDKAAAANKKYFYRLYPAVRNTGYSAIDTANCIVHTNSADVLVAPIVDSVTEGEHSIELLWSKELHRRRFTAYYIEKSQDGAHFVRLNKEPYINMESDLTPKPWFQFADSLKKNYDPNYYRVVGINSFGELSGPSNPIRAMGRDKTAPPPPINVKTKMLPGNRAEISWESAESADLKGFMIGRSQNSLVGFQPVSQKTLEPRTRKFVDEHPDMDTANYYIVVATDTANNASASFSVFNFVADTIAPAKPTGLKASVDTTGTVRLRWDRNREKDLKGYIVFYANQRDHIFTTAVKHAISDTAFADTIQLWTLTKKIYYQLKAEDKTGNVSAASDILELARPDIVPPAPPVFTGYEVKPSTIYLKWMNSNSQDVANHLLYRRSKADPVSRVIMTTNLKAVSSFTDTSIAPAEYYEYKIVAVDSAGLNSGDGASLSVQTPEKNTKSALNSLVVNYNKTSQQAEISWVNPGTGTQVIIYRAENGGGFQTVATPAKGATNWVDKTIKTGGNYEYTTRVSYPDGKASPFGKVSKLIR